MSNNATTLETFVISVQDVIGNNKRTFELTPGQIGMFDRTTQKSITPHAGNLYSSFFAVGLEGGGVLVQSISKNTAFINSRKTDPVDFKPATFTIDQTADYKPDTTYTFTIDFSDYKILGFNTLKKSFSVLTPKNLETGTNGKKAVAKQFFDVINKDGLFKATDTTSTSNKIKVTISDIHYQRVFNPHITLLEGFDKGATIEKEEQVFAVGDLEHVRRLELEAAGFKGHNYPLYNFTGTHDIKYQSKEGKKYNLAFLKYRIEEQTFGFRGAFTHNLVLAFESTIASNNNVYKIF